MGRRKIDGSVAVVFVVGETAIDDVSAPPLAAITDTDNVLDLHHEMTADGFTPNLAEDTKDVSGGTIDLTYFRDSIAANEHAFTRMRRDQRGFLVMRFGMDKDIPFADGQEVEVYPVMCGNQRPGPMPKNSDQTKVQTLYISDAWDDRAVVGGASS
jgi:hypothetical protein